MKAIFQLPSHINYPIRLGDWVGGNRSGKGLYLFAETGSRYKGKH